jgi:alpha-L-rhamnosidase
LIPAELTNRDGSISQGSMNAGRNGVRCEFTKATDGEETWSPKFFYVGCRYVQAHFLPATPNGELPKIKSLAGIVVNSASAPVGEFECSNELFNRIRQLVRWAQRSNMVSLMTDCPHRERLGWLEEDHLNGPALRYEFDLAQLFTKTLNDIADSQLTNGLVPTTAPEYTVFRDNQYPLSARNIRRFAGVEQLVHPRAVAAIRVRRRPGPVPRALRRDEKLSHLLRQPRTPLHRQLRPGRLVRHRPETARRLAAHARRAHGHGVLFQDAEIMARAAALLGKDDDARNSFPNWPEISAPRSTKYFTRRTAIFTHRIRKCANAIPLVMGICEPTNRAAVVDAIVRDVRARGNALTAGDVGYRYLLRALADGGRSDVIFDINNQSDKPGYGLQLKRGATSLTEAWDAGPRSSQNHFMLGQIQEWFYHDLAGIRSDGNGFKKISHLSAARRRRDMGEGQLPFHPRKNCQRLEARWRKFTLQVTIPANTTATVYVPAQSAGTPKAQPAASRNGVKYLREENGRAVYAGRCAENHLPASVANRLADGFDFSLMICPGQVVHLHRTLA